MIVVDASIVVDLLCAGTSARALGARLEDEFLLAPELMPVEVVSALRGLERGGVLSAGALESAADDLARLPVDLHPTLPLVPRILAVRANLTAYDAAYVTLAAALGCPLLTHDRRLARAASGLCAVEVPSP
ncbi:type II toxin-antitoxin system VapC family toxin [Microbacterium sp. BLY]|uniref:type II toxin-antitoxin system VapC family toxin n=1 Tax=Microbacterium sp. BLY TaxID=2823280 RepID=UPI001B31A698|nr:type II toxin-antitoxin system VapC family toxin [Microbacterium sp. BLY]MBP3977270.1 type II toxin-antitoxin system VapC family toxin [Microbacterium sp. BLY]